VAEIAVVDDERLLVESLKIGLARIGHHVRGFYEAADFIDALAGYEPEVVFLDLRLPDANGLDVLARLKAENRLPPTVMITAHGDVPSAIQAMKTGAVDYLGKPFDLDEIRLLIERIQGEARLRREVEYRRARDYKSAGPDAVVGDSPAFLRVLDDARKVAHVDRATILLRGESGTGKDFLAKFIHNIGPRSSRQLIEINCAAIPEQLLESELFGHERGAFTDARTRKTGLVEQADGGTLFLDEIGEMSGALQAKLLRFLETRRFRRVGGSAEAPVDARIIAATNRNLEAAVAEGRFRSDLFYRLNVVPLVLPPLRERSEDVLLLSDYFLERLSVDLGRPTPRLSDEVRRAFLAYSWPGNIRELKNLLERLVILGGERIIGAGRLPREMLVPAETWSAPPPPSVHGSLEERLDRYERTLLSEALASAGGVRAEAARLLGLSRFALLRRLRHFPDLAQRAGVHDEE
jgi:two-component system response regulator AtoC